MRHVLVAGAGGFIGSWLVKRLKAEGNYVVGVDLKHPEFDRTAADEFHVEDLRELNAACYVSRDIDDVYQLAADMGGIGYITQHLADVFRNNMLINLSMLEAARISGVKRYLYTSSACVYPKSRQESTEKSDCGLKESDAYPADPEPGYGWEKLSAEEATRYFAVDHGLDVRIVRFHNVYGSLGTWRGGREKSPAAIARKVASAVDGGSIEVWGDGKAVRSYLYIDDCVDGLVRLMASGYTKPINLGTEEAVTIDELVDLVARIAGKKLSKDHDLSRPEGVRGRNSDNSLLRSVLGWEPRVTLAEGLVPTYEWIKNQVETTCSET